MISTLMTNLTSLFDQEEIQYGFSRNTITGEPVETFVAHSKHTKSTVLAVYYPNSRLYTISCKIKEAKMRCSGIYTDEEYEVFLDQFESIWFNGKTNLIEKFDPQTQTFIPVITPKSFPSRVKMRSATT